MAKKKTEASPAPTEPAARAPRPGAFGHSAVLGRWLVRALPMCCLTTILVTGMRTLWVQAWSDPFFMVSADMVDLRQTGEMGNDFSGIAKAVTGNNLLQPCALSRLEETLRKNAWVESVETCRRILPNRVRADFSVREPYAQVWMDGQYWRVARDGVALPTERAKDPIDGLPVIQCDALPHPVIGAVWDSDAIADALALIDFLRHSPVGQRFDVRIVQAVQRSYLTPALRKKQTQPSLEILTADGVIIKWGEYVEKAGENGALINTEKIDLLRQALEFSQELQRGNVLDVRTRTMTYSGVTP